MIKKYRKEIVFKDKPEDGTMTVYFNPRKKWFKLNNSYPIMIADTNEGQTNYRLPPNVEGWMIYKIELNGYL